MKGDFGEGWRLDAAKLAMKVFVVACDGYHGSIVGGVAELGDVDGPTIALGMLAEGISQAIVGRDATSQSHMLDACLLDSQTQFAHKDVNDCELKARSQVLLMMLNEVRVFLHPVAEVVEKRGLQSAEAVGETGDMGLGKLLGMRISLPCQSVDNGATGITQPHDLGAFVDGLACSIIDGLSEHLHVVVGTDFYNL